MAYERCVKRESLVQIKNDSGAFFFGYFLLGTQKKVTRLQAKPLLITINPALTSEDELSPTKQTKVTRQQAKPLLIAIEPVSTIADEQGLTGYRANKGGDCLQAKPLLITIKPALTS